MQVIPGQLWQRVLALLLCGCSVWLYLLWQENQFPGFVFAISCIFSFLFVLLSIPPLYERWLIFAEWLKLWVTRLLFSVIYFLILPLLQFLRYKDRLGLHYKGQKSLWIERKNRPDDTIEELQRMG